MKKILMAEHGVWDDNSCISGGYHYALRFMENNYKLCWLVGPISPFHFLKPRSSPDLRDKVKLWMMGKRNKNLFSYCPLTLLPYKNFPCLRSKWVGQNTITFTVPPLKSILRRQGFSKIDILWITNLSMHTLLDQTSYKVSVFRFSDDFTQFVHIPKNAVDIQRKIIRKVDVVMCTSKSLFENAEKLRKDVYYIPNGVDYDMFANFNGSEPVEYKEIPHPRIIYVGAIQYWIDIDLLDYAAKSLKRYNFIFIGPQKIDLSLLKTNANIKILGPREYAQIPHYLKYADVGIIPFRKNKLTDSVSPMKLYEYFASGLPVVSTNLNEVKNLNSPCFIADSPEGFVEKVQKAYRKGKDKEDYFQFAKRNSWDKRFELIKSIIYQRTRNKHIMKR